MEDLVVANIIYFLFSFFLIYPPNEVVSSGFTIPALFSSIVGSEHLYFIHHHIIRTCLTVCIHSVLPFGYYLFIGLFVPSLRLFSFECSVYWKIYLSISLIFATTLLLMVYNWSRDNYRNHPICKQLKKLANLPTMHAANSNSLWQVIGNEINIEFRRVDKFSTGTLYNRIYLTDTWFLKVNLYDLVVCKHQNAEFVLTHANDLRLTYDGTPGIQYLNILVNSVANNDTKSFMYFKPFYIFLNSLEYKDFSDKLNRPVKEVCNIIIKQSLPDQFLEAVSAIKIIFNLNGNVLDFFVFKFRNQVNLNPIYQLKRNVILHLFKKK
jgi:E3 ubiquitin-protein ligase TM129